MKKNICLFFVSLTMLFSFYAYSAGSAEPKYKIPSSYKEIPNITKEEIAAIEQIQQSGKTYIFAANESTESFLKEDGTYGGFAKYFTDFLSSLFDIKIQIELREWGALLEGLNSKEVSFSGELTSTPEREKEYFMTSDIAVRSIKIFTNKNAPNIFDIVPERKPRFAFLEGTVTGPDVKKVSPFPFESFYTNSYTEAVEWLRTGKVDAFFEEGSAEAVFHSYSFIKSSDYFPLILSPVSLATADKNLQPVISATEKFLKSGGILYLTELYNKGYNDYRKHILYKNFTPQERDYIASMAFSGTTVKIALENDNYPVCFYNKRAKEFQGIAIDILQEITNLTGLEFESVSTESNSWSELLLLLSSGQADMISELVYLDDRKDKYLFSENIYSYERMALLSKINSRNIFINEILYSKIGLVTDNVYTYIFREWFPNIDSVVMYRSYNDAFMGLEKGEIDFFMGSENSLLAQTNYYENSSFKTSVLFDYRVNSVFGFNKNQELLRSIIEKVMPYINSEELSNRWKNKVFDYSTKILKSQRTYTSIILCITSTLLIIFVVMLIKNRKLSKNLESLVHARTNQLEVKTSLLTSMLTSIPDIVFYKDINGTYTGCNPSFEKFAGISEKELIGKTDKDIFINTEMSDAFMKADKRALETHKTETIEESVVYPDGEKRLLETIRAPLETNGKPAGLIGISRDITERKAAEEAAQVAAKAKGEFLARMSHEIRTPLNAIIGMSNIAKSNIDNKEKALKSIKESLAASHHLLDILNNILDMSKIESGKLEIINDSFSILKAFAEVSNIIIQRCNEKNIKFITNIGDFEDITIIGDKLRLNQILINLLGNAIKFTNPNGEVFFSIEKTAETENDITLNFIVQDSGIGMNDGQIEKLFTAFEQTDKTIASRFGGTGLGLAISQTLVNMMGSNIIVESNLNKGSKFSFSVKFEKNKETDKIKQMSEDMQKTDFSEKRILIVEDIEINRIILRELLSSTKIKTEEAVNGEEAVNKFSSSPIGYYDLIFMDIQMPLLDGYEAAEKIRALNRQDAKTVPIIAMTANAYKEDVEKALQSGMNGHLAKPVDLKATIKALTRHLT